MLLELIAYPICLLSFCLLLTPKWGVINQRVSLDANYEYTALYNCIKTQPFAISLGLIAVADNSYSTAIIAFTLPITMLFLPIVLHRDEHSLLLVQAHWFHPCKVRVHLNKTDQAFNRDTFIELLQLIDTLKQKGIKEIHLSSPLFIKGQAQRKMPHFIALLEKQQIIVQSHPTEFLQFPAATLILVYLKYIKKSSSLTNTAITHWHTYILRF